MLTCLLSCVACRGEILKIEYWIFFVGLWIFEAGIRLFSLLKY